MSAEEREEVVSAHRERTADGRVEAHPRWRDLTPEEREEAYAETARSRALEAALDPDGLSTTARALLDRIRAPREGK